MKKSLGFTLIELLVVISIISLLSSVVLSSVKDAKDKAKGTKFRVEVEEFKKAIELRRLDHNGIAEIVGKYVYYNNSGSIGPSITVEEFNSPSTYIKDFPVLPFYNDGVGATAESFFFGNGFVKWNGKTCQGSKLFIMVTGIKTMKFFSDWSEITVAAGWGPYRCYPISIN
jgi:prepilin-type N-terminal cleavage/methylation domain-containing protein